MSLTPPPSPAPPPVPPPAGPPPALPPSRSGKTRDTYDRILDRLVDGTIAPDQLIPITQTARSLDVSPTPVREVLARLAERGLVIRPNTREYRAAPVLDRRQQEDLLTARLAVEPVLARFACRYADDALVAALEESVVEHRARIDSRPDFAHDRLASEHFHETLAAGACNEFLHQAYVSLGGHVHRFRALGASKTADAGDALREHQAILDAVVARDEEAAELAMRVHIEAMRRRL